MGFKEVTTNGNVSRCDSGWCHFHKPCRDPVFRGRTNAHYAGELYEDCPSADSEQKWEMFSDEERDANRKRHKENDKGKRVEGFDAATGSCGETSIDDEGQEG